uniref:Putative ovule protein n=1 Tax=Solanum chacoense TaxID=4108 RepID=A0A0V0H5D9_SOLCH
MYLRLLPCRIPSPPISGVPSLNSIPSLLSLIPLNSTSGNYPTAFGMLVSIFLIPMLLVFKNTMRNTQSSVKFRPTSSSSLLMSPASRHRRLNPYPSSIKPVLYGMTFGSLNSRTIASRKLPICYLKLTSLMFQNMKRKSFC